MNSKEMLHGLFQAFNMLQLVFFLSSGILFAVEHDAVRDVSTRHFTTAPSRPDAQLVHMSVDEQEHLLASCLAGDYNEYEKQACQMSKLPLGATQRNSEFTIWPGKTMNKGYLLFTLCMISVAFHINFMGSPQRNTEKQHILYLKAPLLVAVYFTLLIMTAVYQWMWGTGFSSMFIGIFMTIITFVYSWVFIIRERSETLPDKMTLINHAMEMNKSMEFHWIKSMCTFPIVVYIVTIDLNNNYADFLYMVLLILAFLLPFQGLLMETKMLINKAVEARLPYNFKSEKLAYLLAMFFTAILFFFNFAYGGDFWANVQNTHLDKQHARNAYYTVFVLKILEIGVSAFIYAIDEVQTFYEGAVQQGVMRDTSNFRFIFYCVTDFIIMAVLCIQFWIDVL